LRVGDRVDRKNASICMARVKGYIKKNIIIGNGVST